MLDFVLKLASRWLTFVSILSSCHLSVNFKCSVHFNCDTREENDDNTVQRFSCLELTLASRLTSLLSCDFANLSFLIEFVIK